MTVCCEIQPSTDCEKFYKLHDNCKGMHNNSSRDKQHCKYKNAMCLVELCPSSLNTLLTLNVNNGMIELKCGFEFEAKTLLNHYSVLSDIFGGFLGKML